MRKKLLYALLFFSLSLPWPSCFAASYTMTEAELTRLEEIFGLLKVSNHQLQTDLAASKVDLSEAQSRLAESETQLAMLEMQLIELRAESEKTKTASNEAQTLLVKANQSLQEYEREVKGQIRSLTWQRNLLGMLAIAAAVQK